MIFIIFIVTDTAGTHTKELQGNEVEHKISPPKFSNINPVILKFYLRLL